MKIAITGGTGFIGSGLRGRLRRKRHEVMRVTRTPSLPEDVRWDPAAGEIEASRLEGCDVVVHLAGENIGGRRWNAQHKARVLDSRVRGTRLVAETIASLRRKPAVLVSASAVGYYGDRGDETLSEESASGSGFLAEVARQWEQSTGPAADAGVRVVHVRSGLVLGRGGGILPRILLPFRLGLGGRIGSGRHWWPWITLEDELGALEWCLQSEDVVGPVNLTAPNPVRNDEFTRTLAAVLRRPAVVPVPARALEIVLGREMARELLLISQRVLPRKLLESGFTFAHPTLERGLVAELI